MIAFAMLILLVAGYAAGRHHQLQIFRRDLQALEELIISRHRGAYKMRTVRKDKTKGER